MKISLNWLSDYTTLPAGLSPKDLAHQLTMATVEVEGVHALPADAATGAPADVILEIDNKSLTNRPDLWGHYGVARELAAIFRVPLKPLVPTPAGFVQPRPGGGTLLGPKMQLTVTLSLVHAPPTFT